LLDPLRRSAMLRLPVLFAQQQGGGAGLMIFMVIFYIGIIVLALPGFG